MVSCSGKAKQGISPTHLYPGPATSFVGLGTKWRNRDLLFRKQEKVLSRGCNRKLWPSFQSLSFCRLVTVFFICYLVLWVGRKIKNLNHQHYFTIHLYIVQCQNKYRYKNFYLSYGITKIIVCIFYTWGCIFFLSGWWKHCRKLIQKVLFHFLLHVHSINNLYLWYTDE